MWIQGDHDADPLSAEIRPLLDDMKHHTGGISVACAGETRGRTVCASRDKRGGKERILTGSTAPGFGFDILGIQPTRVESSTPNYLT